MGLAKDGVCVARLRRTLKVAQPRSPALLDFPAPAEGTSGFVLASWDENSALEIETSSADPTFPLIPGTGSASEG